MKGRIFARCGVEVEGFEVEGFGVKGLYINLLYVEGRNSGCWILGLKVKCSLVALKVEKREPEGRKLKGRKLERHLVVLKA